MARIIVAAAFGWLAWAGIAPASAAKEDIEFVAEHLAESTMDNRYASLPVWAGGSATELRWSGDVQGAFSRTTVGGLALSGPLLSAGVVRRLSSTWSVGALAFFDALKLTTDRDARPLNPSFSGAIPLTLPADAIFSRMDGAAKDYGAGLFARLRGEGGWLGERRWVGGLLWQRVSLRNYRWAYRLLTGPDAGGAGVIDYSADYSHIVPYAGLELLRSYGQWSFSPRVLAAMPLPRRGVQGCITGTHFDLCGDTASAGRGRHFGDPFVALGLGVTYEPWQLTVDLGSTLAQAVVEPFVHAGIDRNWLLSIDWRF